MPDQFSSDHTESIDTSQATPLAIISHSTEDQLYQLNQLNQLDSLLDELKMVSDSDDAVTPVASEVLDNQLAIVRLGMAGCLFTSLRCKHLESAQHSLRVALTTTAWSIQRQMTDQQRDIIEVAALLHDIGMIGLPDDVIFKQGSLSVDESRAVLRARKMSLEILQSACEERGILEIIESVGAWYDGSRPGFDRAGATIPLGARMITIVEAFDAMTTSNIYRPALSHEKAIQELYACSQTQFDGALVREFVEFYSGKQTQIHHQVSKRWLNQLSPATANRFWSINTGIPWLSSDADGNVFESKMLSDMHDAAIFLDAQHRVTRWNHGAERLTGIPSHSAVQNLVCQLLEMRDEEGMEISSRQCDECPIGCSMYSGVSAIRRMKVLGRKNESIPVDCHAMPVTDQEGEKLGAVVVFHDASSQISLEERCQHLQERTKLDPMTRVANRAEFDRVHEAFVSTHRQQDVSCSMVICDIDHFKHVNDSFGHQAGDEVIMSLAELMKSHCRTGDFVARYGGEEFVMLYADCDIASATSRAERMRAAFSAKAHKSLNGRAATASFGVTVLQPGDSAETMLRRADRALLMAKSKGRNIVVQLGGSSESDPISGSETGQQADSSQAPKGRVDAALCQEMFVAVPMPIVIDKLRGFVADHRAKIVHANDHVVWMTIQHYSHPGRRRSDRPMHFQVTLELEERHGPILDDSDGRASTPSKCHTVAKVTVSHMPGRNRRKSDKEDRAGEIMTSLQSYLMPSRVGPARLTNVPEFPGAGSSSWFQRMAGIFRRREAN